MQNSENNYYRRKLKEIFPSFSEASTVPEAMSLINSTVRSVLLISGSMGRYLVPRIHSLRNVRTIIIFCYDVESHREWTTKYDKICYISNDFAKVIERCKEKLSDIMRLDQYDTYKRYLQEIDSRNMGNKCPMF
jgi:hypothetical protein